MVQKEAFRIEKDIMGPVRVPQNAYYGNQTVRAATNFPISGLRINPALTTALIEIKKAAAQANYACKTLDAKRKNAIVKACNEVLKHPDQYVDQFIIDVFQAGAGTPWHMNVNEVLTNKALEIMKKEKGDYATLDPHDHVNKSQSTNDVMMSALRIATLTQLNLLHIALTDFIKALTKKGTEFKRLTKAGRTHMQDAVPITLGQEFDAWAATLSKRKKILAISEKNICSLHLGGTAVGTGFNVPKGFDREVITTLKKNTKLPLTRATNKVEQTQFLSDFLDVSGALRTLATDLTKIANDLRLLSSGPRTGIGEITLPQVEPGSSIMPAKFNPSMVEMLNMICFQVMGNDHTIQQAAEAGQLELNVFGPVLAHNLLMSITILASGLTQTTTRCITGIAANKKTLQHYLEMSPAIGTVLSPVIGYEQTAILIQKAITSDKSVKQVAIEEGVISKRVADKLFTL